MMNVGVYDDDVELLEAQFEADDKIHRPTDQMLSLTVPRSWAMYTASRMQEISLKEGNRVSTDGSVGVGELGNEEKDEYRFPPTEQALVQPSATTPTLWRNERKMTAWVNVNQTRQYMAPRDDPDPNHVPNLTGIVQIEPTKGSRLVPRDYMALHYTSLKVGTANTHTVFSYSKEKECLELSVTPMGGLFEFQAILMECFKIAGAGGQVYDTEKSYEMLFSTSFCSLTGYGKANVLITPPIFREAEESIQMFLPDITGIIVP